MSSEYGPKDPFPTAFLPRDIYRSILEGSVDTTYSSEYDAILPVRILSKGLWHISQDQLATTRQREGAGLFINDQLPSIVEKVHIESHARYMFRLHEGLERENFILSVGDHITNVASDRPLEAYISTATLAGFLALISENRITRKTNSSRALRTPRREACGYLRRLLTEYPHLENDIRSSDDLTALVSDIGLWYE